MAEPRKVDMVPLDILEIMEQRRVEYETASSYQEAVRAAHRLEYVIDRNLEELILTAKRYWEQRKFYEDAKSVEVPHA